MKKIFIFLILFQVFIGCKGTKNVIDKGQFAENDNTFKLTGPNEIKIGAVAYFELINNTQSPITIYSPWQKRIEKFENNTWQRVKIIACPCGADCNAPPKKLVLNPKEKHNYDWNLREGWCGKQQQNGIPETIENNSAEGLYRLIVDYSTGENKQSIIKEFKITK
jgi:hypothetical protein